MYREFGLPADAILLTGGARPERLPTQATAVAAGEVSWIPRNGERESRRALPETRVRPNSQTLLTCPDCGKNLRKSCAPEYRSPTRHFARRGLFGGRARRIWEATPAEGY